MRLRQDRDTTTGSVVKMRLPASNKSGFQYRPHLRGGHSDVAGVHGFVFKGSASVVPITGRHLGERQMSVNFTCRPTIAAARIKLEIEGL